MGDLIHRADPTVSRFSSDAPPGPEDLLPTYYRLSSVGCWDGRMHQTKGQQAYEQAQHLVENLLGHLNRETAWAFIDGFGIDVGAVDLVQT